MRNVNPFLRNLAILAAIALVVVLLNLEVALATVGALLRIAFFIVIGVVAYFFWRDFGRTEIATWPDRSARVFYAAVALGIADIGFWMFTHPSGQNAFVFFVVAAICAYVGIRTWRDQRRLSV
jgi:ABC-type Mn2+/Zn2+ transport system permease subunit